MHALGAGDESVVHPGKDWRAAVQVEGRAEAGAGAGRVASDGRGHVPLSPIASCSRLQVEKARVLAAVMVVVGEINVVALNWSLEA